MRWIKHPSSFCRSAAMTDVREALGPAGYGATWLLLERVAEAWNGQNEPDLRVSMREWTKTCGISTKKLHELLHILESHGIILSENDDSKLRLSAPILLELQDEWTGRTRKNSRAAPEPLGIHSGIQQIRPEEEKNKDSHGSPPPSRVSLYPVLSRHGIEPGSERARRLIRHIEAKGPNNPGGYLESILQKKPNFDPEEPEDRQQGIHSAGDILRRMGQPNQSRGT